MQSEILSRHLPSLTTMYRTILHSQQISVGPHPPHHIQLCHTMAQARKSKAEQGDSGPRPNADNWNSCLYKFLLFRTTKKKGYIPSLDSQDANEQSVAKWIKE